MKRLSFKEKARAQRRREIIVTAARILNHEGSRALTMERVAAEVGISKSTLYQDVSSKEALNEMVVLESLTYLSEPLRNLSLLPLQRIRAFLMAALDVQDDLHRVAARALRDADAASLLVQARIGEVLRMLEENCSSGQTGGQIRNQWSHQSMAQLLLTIAAGANEASASTRQTDWSEMLLQGIAS